MEPTISLSLSIFLFTIFLIPSRIQFLISFLFRSEMPKKRKNRGREGYSSQSRWNFYFIHWKSPFCY